MSHFSETYQELKRGWGLSNAEIRKASHIDQATLSRLDRGARNITFHHLRLLCHAFPNDSGRLLRARLLDECDGPGGKQIEIKVLGGNRMMTAVDEAGQKRIPLPAGLSEWIPRIVAAWPDDARLRNVIQWIAEKLPEVNSSPKQKAGHDTEQLDRKTVDSIRQGRS